MACVRTVLGMSHDQVDWPDDARPLRLIPALVEVRDRYGDPIWILGVEVWTNMVVLRFAGIESEMSMHRMPSDWFHLRDDTGVSYRPSGGGVGGGPIGSALEHKERFSGHLDLTPGLTDGATTLTISFSQRINSEPIEIQIG
jgi:hypothetical protein